MVLVLDVPADRSRRVALRQFPHLYTNPVNVLVGGKPVQASRGSARWCVGVIKQPWRVRGQDFAPAERAEADKTLRQAVVACRRTEREAADGS